MYSYQADVASDNMDRDYWSLLPYGDGPRTSTSTHSFSFPPISLSYYSDSPRACRSCRTLQPSRRQPWVGVLRQPFGDEPTKSLVGFVIPIEIFSPLRP